MSKRTIRSEMTWLTQWRVGTSSSHVHLADNISLLFLRLLDDSPAAEAEQHRFSLRYLQCIANEAEFRLPAVPTDSQRFSTKPLLYWEKR
jgi:hypothetical protein